LGNVRRERSKRRRVKRLKRIAFFACLAALAPLWFSGWTTDILTHARGPAEAAGSPAIARADAPADRSGRMFLAATGRVSHRAAPAVDDPGDRPEGVMLALAVPAAPQARVTPPKPPKPAPKPAAKPRRKTRTIRMLVTAYCPCSKCCSGHSDGVTASGKSVYANRSRFVAADTRLLRFHKKVSIPGYYSGSPVPVYDRGGRIKGRRLDVFFLSHSRARKWGARWLNVTVYD